MSSSGNADAVDRTASNGLATAAEAAAAAGDVRDGVRAVGEQQQGVLEEDVGAALQAAFEEAQQLQQQQQRARHPKIQHQQAVAAAAAGVTITDWTKQQPQHGSTSGSKASQQQLPISVSEVGPLLPSSEAAAAAAEAHSRSGAGAAAATASGSDNAATGAAAAAESAEDRAVGAVRWSIYAAYTCAVGVGMTLAVLISLLLMQVRWCKFVLAAFIACLLCLFMPFV
jgi:hypothetical protein